MIETWAPEIWGFDSGRGLYPKVGLGYAAQTTSTDCYEQCISGIVCVTSFKEQFHLEKVYIFVAIMKLSGRMIAPIRNTAIDLGNSCLEPDRHQPIASGVQSSEPYLWRGHSPVHV